MSESRYPYVTPIPRGWTIDDLMSDPEWMPGLGEDPEEISSWHRYTEYDTCCHDLPVDTGMHWSYTEGRWIYCDDPAND